MRSTGQKRWVSLGCGCVGIFLLAVMSFACGVLTKKIYKPEELKTAVAERMQDRLPPNFEVPYQVDPKYVRLARKATKAHSSLQNRAVALVSAMFSKSYFGLEYADVATSSANETLRTGKGNCLSLSSVYVGLARAIGLQSYYLDVSARVNDLQRREYMTVRMGHITSAVETETNMWLLDVRHLFRHITHYRMMDDLEAVAHFYNNRGYELIEEAQQERKKVDWERVIDMFSIATQIKPNFYRAWNNLGVAYVRTDQLERAERCYLRAIAEKKFVSPYFNLGLLYLLTRNYHNAIKYFKIAAKLESDNSQIQYQYGVALLGNGQTQEAEDIFEKVIDLNEKNKKARRFLKKIHFYHQTGLVPSLPR